jgi:hypothetical protein
MRPDDPNLPLLTLIAGALGDLREELVFVGGCAAGLLLDDPAAGEIRATQDVDAIVEATTLVELYRVEARLPERGFVRAVDSDVICRWRHRATGALFDLMPVSPDVLGFANSWYPEAVRTAIRVTLDERISIRLIAAPAFVATKLEAFATRGRNDFLASHDLEDVLNVIEGRPRLVDEMRAADPGLRAAVQSQFRRLLAEQDFVENLPGMVKDADLGELLLQRLRDMAV